MDGVLESKISMLEAQIAALEARIEAATAIGPTYPVFEGMPGFGDGGGAWTVEVEEKKGSKKIIKVTNCYVYFSRKLKKIEDFTVPRSGGRVCIVINHKYMDLSLHVMNDDSDDEKTVIPIFKIDIDGEITEDYRRIPFIQFYE